MFFCHFLWILRFLFVWIASIGHGLAVYCWTFCIDTTKTVGRGRGRTRKGIKKKKKKVEEEEEEEKEEEEHGPTKR